MKIAVIFFSATNNTAKMARFIVEQLKLLENNILIDEIDITNHSARLNKFDMKNYDAIYFGFPIHALRAPEVVRKWLKTLKGKNKKCSVFFTYGGVDVGVSHSDIKNILNRQGFKLVSTAEFVSKHSYNFGGWNLAENRPNDSDFNLARNYVKKTQEIILNNGSISLQFDKSKLPENFLLKILKTLNNNVFPPSRRGKECSLCNTCEESCPTNAMDSKSGEANPKACIRCFRCFTVCPEKTLSIGDLKPQLNLIKKTKKISRDIIIRKKSMFFT